MAITNTIGAPVTGENFYGRKNELETAHRYLNERQSLLLSAPRRIGKSSFAKKLLADKGGENWTCIYIDLQGIATKETFLRRLIDSFTKVGIMEKTKKKVKDFCESLFDATKGVELGFLKVDLSHRDSFESTYNRLSETLNHDTNTLIVIDELPLFLGKLMNNDASNRDEVEFLLNWFRSIRQIEKSRLRWIFCGSVGLRNFTSHYRMSQAINDLVDFNLGELTCDEAQGLIKALAQSYNLSITDDVVNQTLDLLQWPIPYFIQLLIDRLISNKEGSGKTTVDMIDVTSAIDKLSHSDYFITWDERLDEYRDLESLSRLILNNLSLSSDGLSKEILLRIAMNGKEPTEEPTISKNLAKVLEMLEHDGYIMRKDGNRIFRSPLLRNWWRHKFND